MNNLYNINWKYGNFMTNAYLIIILLDLNIRSTYDLDLSINL